MQRNDVNRSLNFTNMQLSQLNSMTDRLQSRYADRFNQLSSLSDTERASRSAALNQQFLSEWMAGARDVMNPQQMTRYQQLVYQFGGFNTFNDPAVQKQLNLTPTQLGALRDQVTWSDQQWQAIQAAPNRDRAMQLYTAYTRAYADRLSRWLTPDQMKVWQQAIGDPFEFAPALATPASGTGGSGTSTGTGTGTSTSPGGPSR